MNSYPPELMVQLAPVMFVAGLDVTPEPESTVTASQGEAPSPPRVVSDPFEILTRRLHDALATQRKPAIWQPEKTKTFQVQLVDKVRVHAPEHGYPLIYSGLGSEVSSEEVYHPGWRRERTTKSLCIPFTPLTAHDYLTTLPRRPHRSDMGEETHSPYTVCVRALHKAIRVPAIASTPVAPRSAPS